MLANNKSNNHVDIISFIEDCYETDSNRYKKS